MIELNTLKTLLLIAELGSFAAAANKLQISPAAVSKQISKLEGDLGIQLINRSTRKLEFTDVGESYIEQCKRIIEEVDEANNLILNAKKKPHGPLKIFSGRHFAFKYIVPNIGLFLAKYPDIELTLELGERMPDLEQELIDVLVGMSISATGKAVQKRIATTRYCYCASPNYLKDNGVPKVPENILEHRYITHCMRIPDNVLIFTNKEKIKLVPYIKTNDVEAMLSMALQGLGIVKLHEYVVKENIEKKSLVEVLHDYSEKDIPLYIAYRERRFMSSKIRCFIDFIETMIKRL